MSIRSTRRLATLLTLLWASSAAGAQLVEIRDGAVVSVRISGKEPNRLLVRDGRVHKVWGAEGKVTLKADGDTGQVYLQPNESWHNRPFSLFVKDDEGGVYTLVLTPADIPAETVTLVRPNRKTTINRQKAAAWETGHPYERTLLEFVKHMALGTTPEGYVRTEVNREIKLWQEAKLLLLNRYAGSRLEGEVYELTNVDGKKMRLDEREFYRVGVLAVAVDRHELAPGATTRIYLVVQGGGL